MSNVLKNELRNVISGKSEVCYGAIIQTITNYLEDCKKPSTRYQKEEYSKEKETKNLESFISLQNLWFDEIDYSQYVSEGAEQKVYLKDSQYIIKLNDSIYYSFWLDYFHNLLLHNFFFPDTAYELIGFTKKDDILYAVVKQKFVLITSNTDLNEVKLYLDKNGFLNKKNNDYYHPELGVILEDLHDENVLTQNGIHYFIDTVFYLTRTFWED